MTNMHGWTHLPKSQGGTDPIPGMGDSEWVKLYYTGSTITVNAGDFSVVLFDQVDNNYTSTFSTATVGSGASAHKRAYILRSGVYAIRYRLMIAQQPGGHFTTDINGIDWNTMLYYERTHYGPALTGRGVHDSFVFRSGPDYGDTPPEFYLVVRNPAANSTSLKIDSDAGRHGTYMEIMRLGPATQDTAY